MIEKLIAGFAPDVFAEFIAEKLPDYSARKNLRLASITDHGWAGVSCAGLVPSGDSFDAPLAVVAIDTGKEVLSERASRTKQFRFAKESLRLMLEDASIQGAVTQGLFLFHDAVGNFRLSLVTAKAEGTKLVWSSFKRQSFYVQAGHPNRTFRDRMSGTWRSLAMIREAFSVEKLAEEFYKKLFDWYSRAVESKDVCFPNELKTDKKPGTVKSEQIIRLITRLMFVWFIKQKHLVPDVLFDAGELDKILKDFEPESKTDGNYYRTIIQNLFFATLNCEVTDREFVRDEGYNKNRRNQNQGLSFRYEKSFAISENKVLTLFELVPFLNGGLFECLDKRDEDEDGIPTKEVLYYDGFSRNTKKQALIPNSFFFGVEGILSLLKEYHFTIDENSPGDEEVALDPELLGKVFENLLGAFNPETQETARKATGSFYTPREIVGYMVNESLIAHLVGKCESANADTIRLFVEEGERPEDSTLRRELDAALGSAKILDPACGSGAFPMGMLLKMVELLRSLRGMADSASVYDLKLQLIENCIYGSDIQPVAVQITKLRFFISLICEEGKTSEDPAKNYGINPLPNLETKFVAANSLIGLEKAKSNEQMEFFDTHLDDLRKKLERVQHKHFNAKTPNEKTELRREDAKLRSSLVEVLKNDFQLTAKTARQLAKWNPYDQNVSSDWLDTEWMFNVSGGFDVIIGNPPYISTKDITSKEKEQFLTEYGFSDDTYSHFFFKGCSLLKSDGVLSYIVPKTFWTIQTKQNLRALLLEKQFIYIFDTANPFESVMVDTCIIAVVNHPPLHKFTFSDGSEDLRNPLNLGMVDQQLYLNTQNTVIFKPTKANMKIHGLYGEKVRVLCDQWWNKISTSKKQTQNKEILEEYRNTLKPGDIALLGCLTDGGVGLQTGNNGKYIAIRKSTKWAENVLKSRPKKLFQAVKDYKIDSHDFKNGIPSLDGLNEAEIIVLFDHLKKKYGRDIFGKGYIYRLIDDDEIADVDLLTDDEKQNGISVSKKYYVPYDKGDKDGNRWYLETPFAIAWSKENVRFLTTNSGKKGEGMPVIRNPQFNFKEGFCWSDINTTFLKCREKPKSINDVKSMSLYTLTDKVPEYFIISLINSNFISLYVDSFVNNTQTFQINDARQIPVIIPSSNQLNVFRKLFVLAVNSKKEAQKSIKSGEHADNTLCNIETQLNHLIEELYSVNTI